MGLDIWFHAINKWHPNRTPKVLRTFGKEYFIRDFFVSQDDNMRMVHIDKDKFTAFIDKVKEMLEALPDEDKDADDLWLDSQRDFYKSLIDWGTELLNTFKWHRYHLAIYCWW